MAAIFPKDFLENSIEQYQSTIKVRSQIIYLSFVMLVFIGMALLPFLYIDVAISSKGIIQSKIDKTNVISPLSGRIQSLFVQENQKVDKGEILLEIDDSNIQEKILHLKTRRNHLLNYISDLKLLLQNENEILKQNFDLRTPIYNQQLNEFREELSLQYQKVNKFKKDYKRDLKLYHEQVIAKVKIEEKRFKLDQAKKKINIITQNHRNSWAADKNRYEKEVEQLRTDIKKLKHEQKHYKIYSNINGSIQNLNSIQKGSFVYANQSLIEISPDSSIVATCYVSPSDIGLLKLNQPAKFQIDAFNYNEWGLVEGKIIEISNDVYLNENNQPYFKVICDLKSKHLYLDNGYKGNIKKGMTFKARFLITERTLFQLLYDKVDDWLNPSQ